MALVEVNQFEKEWQEPYKWIDEFKQWLKERPQEVIDVMLRFPPDAKVKAKEGYTRFVPAPGQEGIVISHIETDDGVMIRVGVLGVEVNGVCDPDYLELIAERPGLEIKTIKKMLEGN